MKRLTKYVLTLSLFLASILMLSSCANIEKQQAANYDYSKNINTYRLDGNKIYESDKQVAFIESMSYNDSGEHIVTIVIEDNFYEYNDLKNYIKTKNSSISVVLKTEHYY